MQSLLLLLLLLKAMQRFNDHPIGRINMEK
jgi:hypothetical protein